MSICQIVKISCRGSICILGQEQTRDDLQEMCDKMTGSTHGTDTLDTTTFKQCTTDHRLTGATKNEYEVDMLSRDVAETTAIQQCTTNHRLTCVTSNEYEVDMLSRDVAETTAIQQCTTDHRLTGVTSNEYEVDMLSSDVAEKGDNAYLKAKEMKYMDVDESSQSSMNDDRMGYKISRNALKFGDTNLNTGVDIMQARDREEGQNNANIKHKIAINMDIDGSSPNNDIIYDTINVSNDKISDTNMKGRGIPSSFEPIPEIAVSKVTDVEGENIKTSENPVLASILAKPKLAKQSRFVLTLTAQPVQPVTSSSSNEATKLGVYCATCEIMFSNQTSFKNHEEKCRWVCKLCEKEFAFNHHNSKDRERLYLNFKKKLDQHKKECDRTCKLCGLVSRDPNLHSRHMKTRHSIDKKYSCDICFYTFDSESYVYNHKITNHTGKNGIYRCPLCSNEYIWLHDIQTHFRKEHPPKEKKEIACSLCGKLCTTAAIKRHEESHKVKDVKCDQCPAMFRNQHYLRLHQRRHAKDYSHYCDICAKGFYTSAGLQTHRRVHTGEKPYSCSLCEYSCNVKGNLDKHMKIHNKPSSGNAKE